VPITVGRRMTRRIILIATAALLLAGCDMRPDHAEWQSQCVEDHTDVMMLPSYNPALKMTTLQPHYTTTCDRYEPVCVGGKDGSTVCEGQL
jgi:hypothetical protein